MNGQIAKFAFERLCRLALGALFMYSAWAKIGDPGVFADAVVRYEMLPDFMVGMFSLTMPMLELVAGFALVFTKWTRESALLIAVMLLMFMVALAQALVRGLEISCGCFGVPEVGGRAEMWWALARDVVMFPFAVWLAFRPNTWFVPVASIIRGRFAIALTLLAALPSLAAIKASSGPVKPGEWNADFNAVRAAAERERRPMVLVHVGQRCLFCARLEKAMAGEAFRLWREDRAPYMALVRSKASDDQAEMPKKSYEFIKSISSEVSTFPYVCVWWPKDGSTNSVAFTGRREHLKVKAHHRLLVMDFMSVLDDALGYVPSEHPGHKTLPEILKAATVRISSKAEGGGNVAMKPASGVLPEGGTVALTAKPAKGNVFVCWKAPDGSVASWAKKLDVQGGMAAGCYVAQFRPNAECLPPTVLSPAATSICTRVYDQVKYAVKVADTSRPVTFRAKKRLPRGLKLNDVTGVLSGAPLLPGTNTIAIAVVGSDPARTEKTVSIRFEAAGRPFVEDDEKDKDGDDEKDR